MNVRATWFACVVLTACAGSQQHASSSLLESMRSEARALDVHTRSPERWHRALNADARAQTEPPGSPARSMLSTTARLWLEAALVDAHAQRASEQRLAVDRELAAADEASLAQRGELLATEREIDRLEAAEIATLEAQRAYERAAQNPALRTKLSHEETLAAARALLVRAELVQLALPETSSRRAERERTGQRIESARKLLASDPARALDEADRALTLALSLLEPPPSGASGPSDDEKQALAEALRTSVAAPKRSERGLSLTLANAFRGVTLDGQARKKLERVCVLARGYPAGKVQVTTSSEQTQASEARKLQLEKALASLGCDAQRFVVTHAAGLVPQGALDLTFLAY